MYKGPKCIQSLWNHPEKNPFVQKHKESAICAILTKKTHLETFPEAKKTNWRSQLHAPKVQNVFKPFGTIRKKIPFVQKHRESAICAILREKPHFEAFTEAKKANWCSQLHAQRSKMHSIPLGPSKKNSFYAKE